MSKEHWSCCCWSSFADQPEPRTSNAQRLILLVVLTIAWIATICGAGSCADFAGIASSVGRCPGPAQGPAQPGCPLSPVPLARSGRFAVCLGQLLDGRANPCPASFAVDGGRTGRHRPSPWSALAPEVSCRPSGRASAHSRMHVVTTWRRILCPRMIRRPSSALPPARLGPSETHVFRVSRRRVSFGRATS